MVQLVDRFAERGAGTVAGQDPPAGTPLPPGSEVVIYVATGNVEIPSVLNRPEQEAESTLHEAGLQSDTARRPSETIPAGMAIYTDPTAGMIVPSGTKVRVFISQGR
jgi:serine/threonine-protein kinase